MLILYALAVYYPITKGEALEMGAFSSIYLSNVCQFERFITILRTFYFDFGGIIGESKGKFALLGLDLMRLLTLNRLSEFHCDLELLSDCRDNPFIQFPIQIEQSLMEGSYHKISALKKLAPSNEYTFFLDILMTTIRSEIASCMEKSYCSIAVNDVPSILLAKNENEVLECVQSRNWQVIQNQFHFSTCSNSHSEIVSGETTRNMLHYASEMEKIV